MMSLSACIEAAKMHGRTALEDNNYNYKTKNIKNYNYNKPTCKKILPVRNLYQFINSDKTMAVGLGWGMSGGLLYNLCQSHGVDTVKRSIDYVARLPEPKRNGRYCRVVILNGGPKTR